MNLVGLMLASLFSHRRAPLLVALAMPALVGGAMAACAGSDLPMALAVLTIWIWWLALGVHWLGPGGVPDRFGRWRSHARVVAMVFLGLWFLAAVLASFLVVRQLV